VRAFRSTQILSSTTATTAEKTAAQTTLDASTKTLQDIGDGTHVPEGAHVTPVQDADGTYTLQPVEGSPAWANADRAVPEATNLVKGMIQGDALPRVSAINEDFAKKAADAYEALPKNDPAAKASYDALNSEVDKQFQAIQDAGYKIEYVDKDPYKNSAEMMADVRDNKTLKVF